MIRLLSRFSGTAESRIGAAWSAMADEFRDLWACLRFSICLAGLALGLLAIAVWGSTGS